MNDQPHRSPRAARSRILFLLLGLALFASAHQALGQSSVPNWKRWTANLITARDYLGTNGNPYRDLKLRVTYTPAAGTCSGGAQVCAPFTGLGFWDGGQTFKVRAALPAGTWNWSTTCAGTSNGQDCSTDPALDSVVGGGQGSTTAFGQIVVQAASPPNPLPTDPYRNQLPYRGFLRVAASGPSAGRILVYADGVKPFFWQGDTAWSAQVASINSTSTWSTYLADRRQRGFTTVLLATAPSGDNAALATGTLFTDLTVPGGCLGDAWPKSCSRIRPPFWRQLDEKIRIANEDFGLLVVLIGVMDPQGNVSNSGNGLKYPRAEDAAIFARHLAARLAGSHVIYSPSFDDPLANRLPLLTAVANAIHEAAPRHLVTAHLAGSSPLADYDTVAAQPWHQLHAFQSGHAGNTSPCLAGESAYDCAVRRAREMSFQLSSRLPAKPAGNAEAAYDATYSEATAQTVNSPYGVRHTGYNSTLGGAFGFTLGVNGIWDWTNVTSTTLDGGGSRQVKILGDRFRLQSWELLRPRPDYVRNNPTGAANEDKVMSLAAARNRSSALLYLPDDANAEIDGSSFVGLNCAGTPYSIAWINPKTGATVNGASCAFFSTPLANGATLRLTRPSCPSGGAIGSCDWVVSIARTGSVAGVSRTTGKALTLWPDEDGNGGWRISGQLLDPAGAAAGGPLSLGDPSAGRGLLKNPVSAPAPGDGFVVVWQAEDDGDDEGIFVQAIGSAGLPLGSATPVSLTTAGAQIRPALSLGEAGGAVAWTSFGQDGDQGGIFLRRLDADGFPTGPEIGANTIAAGHQDLAQVLAAGDGSFVVAWSGPDAEGKGEEVWLRRFSPAGLALGLEVQANTTAAGAQVVQSLDPDGAGGFVVSWVREAEDGSDLGVYRRSFDANGVPLGGEVVVVPPPNDRS